ncbi:MAG: tyrosine-type recombinase/integrase [Victivallaceae bacterium]
MKKFIKPIKNMTDLVLWGKNLKETAPLPVYAFYVVGLDTGISPQFLLNLKWTDIKLEETGSEIKKIEPYFEIYCELAGESRKIFFSNRSLEILNQLREKYPEDVYIFQSHAVNVGEKIQPFAMSSIGYIFKEAARDAKIEGADEVSAVTLRKSFGYHHLVNGAWSIHQLTRYFDHKYTGITRKYIDLKNEKINTKQLPRKRRK